MELLIVVAIWTVVVKRGVEDIIHTVKGGTPPRYAAAKARRKSGAAGRYWGQLWDDTWDDMSRRHAERRGRRLAPSSSSSRPRGAATQFFAGLFQDGRRAARRSWDGGWTRLDERRREKSTRPRPGQQTVPGTVVPNRPAQDGDETITINDERQDDSRPRDEDRPQDDTGPGDGTEEIIRPDASVRDCRNCTTRHWYDQYCLIVTDDPWIGEGTNGQDEPESVPDYPPDFGPDQTSSPPASTTTQEGTTTMTTTMPTDTEVVSLNKAIEYSESTARVAAEMVNSIDFTESSLAAGGVTGVAVAEFTSAKEGFGSIAAAMTRAAAEFKAQLAIQEAYDAHPGAGSKEFIMGGR
jgi:hypothetical protein